MEAATWENLESLKQRFPRAPAWGQAVSEDRGNVSSQGGKVIQEEEEEQAQEEEAGRPKRNTRPPTWLATDEWLILLLKPQVRREIG